MEKRRGHSRGSAVCVAGSEGMECQVMILEEVAVGRHEDAKTENKFLCPWAKA